MSSCRTLHFTGRQRQVFICTLLLERGQKMSSNLYRNIMIHEGRILLVTPLCTGRVTTQWTECLALIQCLYTPPGQAALPLLQHTRQGNRAHQVFPRVLLRMSQDALRHPTEEVPQVQLCLRSQRLSPHLHHLIYIEAEETAVERTKGGEEIEKQQMN